MRGPISDWVPCHRRLVKGPKKYLPRGVRFVLLELSLEARPSRGIIDLPIHWSTLKGVHDLLGGNRREIKKALEEFQKPDELGQTAIRIERDESKHRLIITKWEEWAGPKSSAERVAAHRERQKNGALANGVTLHPSVTSNASNRLQERRGEESTGEESANVTTPPPPTSPNLPGLADLERQIRRFEIFAPLDAHAIARHQAERMMTNGQRVSLVVKAIEECAAKHVGLGLSPQALQSRLDAFMRNARPTVAESAHKPKPVEVEEKLPTPEELAAKRRAMDERAAKIAAERKRREEIGQPLGGPIK
jgi:hypothetical protein